MGEKMVTKMLIKVDLQCWKCYRKIKKILCSFPQIRDQIYDEKQNTVTIMVVCCSPEKIKAKICCKGGDTILGIEIIPDKPKEPKKKKDPKKKKEPEEPKETTVEVTNEPPKEKLAPLPELAPPNAPVPVPLVPQVPVARYPPVYVVGTWYRLPCYRGCGPCCHCYGRPAQMCHDGCGRPANQCQGGNHVYSRLPQMCHDGCGRPAYECQGGTRGYYVSSCGDFFSEENASGCTVM